MTKKQGMVLTGILIAGILLTLTGFRIWQGKADKAIAVIIQDDRVIERIDLATVTEPRTISVSGDYHNIIRVEKGRIRFEESDCPEQICVHAGWQSKYGHVAVCMPNKALITIEKE